MAEEEGAPPPEPEKPRRLSFREANLGPEHKPEPHGKPPGFFTKRKRSVTVGVLAVGATAAVLFGLGHRNSNCDQLPPDQRASCGSHGGGGSGGGHSYGFFSGSSSSDAGSTSRGGFGATGSAHAGGGE